MRDQVIVTMGREHGSGGHYVARLIAEQLGIPLYDKALVENMIQISGYSSEMITKMDEKPKNFFTSRRIGDYTNSLEEIIAEKTFEFIREKADSGESFVVVGRCAEYVLRDNPNVVKVFVSGERSAKIKHLMELEHVSESRAIELMKYVDRKRKTYHNFYSDMKWGDSRAYDIMIKSTQLGIPEASNILVAYISAFMNM